MATTPSKALSKTLSTSCCIAGGGPAGIMLGFLLARAGVEVVVLEKHRDFFRDFRGDTVHPSTLELMVELGLIDAFLKLPHQDISKLTAQIGADRVEMADFSNLPTHCKYVAMMPQWDFLNFLAGEGRRYPGFDLRLQAEATDLIETNGRVSGLRATTPEGELVITADLVVGADGRHSTTRERSGLQSRDLGAPMDVLWFRISRKPSDEGDLFGHIEAGRLMFMLDRGDYWQCAYVIPKGGSDAVYAGGIAAFRDNVLALSPFLGDRIGELKSFDDVKLLTVTVDRLEKWWRPGFLCIGDAAHAMSPIGGVGINLAVQDAVAAANQLAAPLRNKSLSDDDLAAVQRRREWPVKLTQGLQVFIQNRIVRPALQGERRPRPPLPFKLLAIFPALRGLTARVIGLGFRPEHIRTPDVIAATK
jgi:2-polyprenyl-6-methoxyphenol hydroxylase-like FAD-dependent oxidoreductase